MIVYVIFQESLYNAINKCKQIMPAEINARKIKIEGYADDTTVFLNDDQRIMDYFEIMMIFELATNSRINIRRLKVIGYGNGKIRSFCPIKNIEIDMDYFKT